MVDEAISDPPSADTAAMGVPVKGDLRDAPLILPDGTPARAYRLALVGSDPAVRLHLHSTNGLPVAVTGYKNHKMLPSFSAETGDRFRPGTLILLVTGDAKARFTLLIEEISREERDALRAPRF